MPDSSRANFHPAGNGFVSHMQPRAKSGSAITRGGSTAAQESPSWHLPILHTTKLFIRFSLKFVFIGEMQEKADNQCTQIVHGTSLSSMYTTLHESLQQVLVQRLGWTSLREVQEEACKAVRGGRDVLIIAPTAGGKTEAALIPVIDSILKHGGPGVSCLYISPLKALINDQEERFATFCTMTGLDLMKWHGDVPKGDRSWKSAEPPQILMITPESLEVLLLEPALSADLVHLRFIIIDEVHAFVESETGDSAPDSS